MFFIISPTYLKAFKTVLKKYTKGPKKSSILKKILKENTKFFQGFVHLAKHYKMGSSYNFLEKVAFANLIRPFCYNLRKHTITGVIKRDTSVYIQKNVSPHKHLDLKLLNFLY